MTNPDQYMHDVLVDWMEKNDPETLTVIRSNDIQATSAAVLGWMAKNKAGDLRQIQSVWEESVDDDTDQNDLECVGALIFAIESAIGPWMDMSRFQAAGQANDRAAGSPRIAVCGARPRLTRN
jgi:hypothetical protein